MRRAAVLAMLLLATLGVAGCAGADGQRAQELLSQSNQALAQVETFRFSGQMTMEMPVGSFTFTMTGAGRQTGTPASIVTMRADGVPGFPLSVVSRGDVVWTKMADGAWVRSVAPAGQATGLEQFDFTPFVKDVEVEDGQEIAGEPAVKLTGVLDTSAMVEGMLGQFGPLMGGGDMSQVLDGLGDTRVVLYISERSHLPLHTLVDMTIEAGGQSADMHLDFTITGVNEPVKIPQPRG
ncbi:MAG: LolA family protein [Gaiellaceae bacterium]